MISFIRITHATHADLVQIKVLYETAFPLHERRTWEALLKLLQEPGMELNSVKKDNNLIGFVIYWLLEGWLYLEHIAIEPVFHGQRLGTEVMAFLLKKANNKIILETETPATEVAMRRIKFYEMAGLKVLPYSYKQPAYRKNEPAVEMAVMASLPICREEFQQIRILIRKEVYERFY